MLQTELRTTPTPDEILEECGSWIARTAARLCQRMPWADYDDLVQEGMLKALELRGKFSLHYGVSFLSFIRPRVHGSMIDLLRRQGSLNRRDERAAHEHTDSEEPGLLDVLVAVENLNAVTAAIESLPDMERTVIALFYLEEMNNREIAAILNISEPKATRVRQGGLSMLSRSVKERTGMQAMETGS